MPQNIPGFIPDTPAAAAPASIPGFIPDTSGTTSSPAPQQGLLDKSELAPQNTSGILGTAESVAGGFNKDLAAGASGLYDLAGGALKKILPSSLGNQIPNATAAMGDTTPHGTAENVGAGAGELMQWAGGDEALKGFVHLAATPQAILKLIEEHPTASKMILDTLRGGGTGAAVGAVKGAGRGDALGGAESGALAGAGGGALASGIAAAGGAAIPKGVTQEPEEAYQDFKNAIPPKKSTPYEREDYEIARNHIEPRHAAVEPIKGNATQKTVDALDNSIEAIEDKIHENAVGVMPKVPLKADILGDVRSALSTSPKEGYAEEGLRELSKYNLKDPTIEDADKIRRDLNAENKAVLKKNQYDLATARSVDAGFAAREAAANAIRKAEYGQFVDHGIEGVQQIRNEEGSLIRVRNAAQDQIYRSDKVVRGSGTNSLPRKLGQAGITAATAAAGGGAGSVMGPAGTAAGTMAGTMIGKDLAEKALPVADLTRDELLERSFSKKTAQGQPGTVTVNLKAPEPKAPAKGTQAALNIPDPLLRNTEGNPSQTSLFEAGAQPPAVLQSPQSERISLQKDVRPLQNIINSPTATAAEKAEAAHKLANLPLHDLANPTVESGATPKEKAAAAKIKLPEKTPKEIIESQGLTYKGEAAKGSGVHMFEDPKHSGQTAALKTEDITPKNVKEHMAVKLRMFREAAKALGNQE